MKPSTKLPGPSLDGFGEPELVNLDERSAHVLRMRSGIWDGRRHTLKEIGEELGLGSERIRQIERQGLIAIRQDREIQRHLPVKRRVSTRSQKKAAR